MQSPLTVVHEISGGNWEQRRESATSGERHFAMEATRVYITTLIRWLNINSVGKRFKSLTFRGFT